MQGFHLLLSLATAVVGLSGLNHPGPGKSVTFSPSEKVLTHRLGDRTISVKMIQYGDVVNTCCINVHDNERTAVEAARAVLEKEGGILIKIENNAQRFISFSYKGQVYTFDPNRIFSRAGILLTLRTRGKVNPGAIVEVEKFAAQLLTLVPDSITCVIALHNNYDGDFSVKTYLPGGKRQRDAKLVYADEWQDIDDIALTTDHSLYDKMASFGYNSILQDNENVFRDGSLSVYYGELNRRYVNIETQHGKNNLYQEMLTKLLSVLDEERRPPAGLAVVPPAPDEAFR